MYPPSSYPTSSEGQLPLNYRSNIRAGGQRAMSDTGTLTEMSRTECICDGMGRMAHQQSPLQQQRHPLGQPTRLHGVDRPSGTIQHCGGGSIQRNVAAFCKRNFRRIGGQRSRLAP